MKKSLQQIWDGFKEFTSWTVTAIIAVFILSPTLGIASFFIGIILKWLWYCVQTGFNLF